MLAGGFGASVPQDLASSDSRSGASSPSSTPPEPLSAATTSSNSALGSLLSAAAGSQSHTHPNVFVRRGRRRPRPLHPLPPPPPLRRLAPRSGTSRRRAAPPRRLQGPAAAVGRERDQRRLRPVWRAHQPAARAPLRHQAQPGVSACACSAPHPACMCCRRERAQGARHGACSRAAWPPTAAPRLCPLPVLIPRRAATCSYGFVRYGNVSEAQAAIGTLDGTSVLGHTLQVKFADADAGEAAVPLPLRIGSAANGAPAEPHLACPGGARRAALQTCAPRGLQRLPSHPQGAAAGAAAAAQPPGFDSGTPPTLRAGPPTVPAPSGLTPSDSCYVKHLPASYGVSGQGAPACTGGVGRRPQGAVQTDTRAQPVAATAGTVVLAWRKRGRQCAGGASPCCTVQHHTS